MICVVFLDLASLRNQKFQRITYVQYEYQLRVRLEVGGPKFVIISPSVKTHPKASNLISYLGSGAKMFALQDSLEKTEGGKSVQLGAKISVLQD